MLKILLYIGCVVLLSDGLIAPTPTDGYSDPDAKLRKQLDRADLVIVATPQTECGSCMSEGPIADGIAPNYNSFLPHVKVERVLKGSVPTDKLLWVSYTLMHVWPKSSPIDVTKHVFSFDVNPKSATDDAFPWAPRKGKAYVFILENRKLREPNSYEAAGKEEIIYQNFDYAYEMMPASLATVSRIERLLKGL